MLWFLGDRCSWNEKIVCCAYFWFPSFQWSWKKNYLFIFKTKITSPACGHLRYKLGDLGVVLASVRVWEHKVGSIQIYSFELQNTQSYVLIFLSLSSREDFLFIMASLNPHSSLPSFLGKVEWYAWKLSSSEQFQMPPKAAVDKILRDHLERRPSHLHLLNARGKFVVKNTTTTSFCLWIMM